MLTDLSLDVVLYLHVDILFANISTQTVHYLLLVLFNNPEYQEDEICAQWKVSLLELTSCPFDSRISSRGVDLDCPDGIGFSILFILDRRGTCINLAIIKSGIAPPDILVITGIVTGVVSSHNTLELHKFVFLIMENPGQDSIFLFAL